MSEDAVLSTLRDRSVLLSWALQSLNHNRQRKTCLSRLHHRDMICQGWIMLFSGVPSTLHSFFGAWVALAPLAERPASSLIPFGVRLSSLEELLILPISQWGIQGHCVILGNEWSGLVYTSTDLFIYNTWCGRIEIHHAAGCTYSEGDKFDKC